MRGPDPLGQPAHGPDPEVFGVDMHGRQGRGIEPRGGDVVEADHRDVVRNPEPVVRERGHRAEGGGIVGTLQRGDPARSARVEPATHGLVGDIGLDQGGTQAVEKLAKALKTPDRDSDPGLSTGHGWTAEEALATALHCFLLYVDDPVLAIRRAAATGGDSDSIACIAGSLAGAYHGNDAWPEAWRDRIEYKDRIQKLADWY